MAALVKVALLAGPILLLLLTGVAGFAYSQIKFLSLPIPQALALFTVVLPLLTGFSTQVVYSLIQRSSRNEQNVLALPLIAVIGFQLIYETVVATLALTHIIPPDALVCNLGDRWMKLYKADDGDAVRAIQDSFKCCGFKTVKDNAFPWGQPSPCPEIFHYTKSCLKAWRKAEQISAGLLLLVAIVVFILKVLSVIALLSSSSWTESRWVRPFYRFGSRAVEGSEGDDNRATMRRLIEEGIGDEGYHDDPSEGSPTRGLEAGFETHEEGSRILPSLVLDSGNEWREDGDGHRD
ncbi:hypothetical protein L207DRAFT_577289 [Hyaloscypha variabilis F]|uniref:Tetraspanin Tsp3 n=1 Tax=Hyaloscypha variabilis (strain UAMH 11265 / GT02V1 / F) TaxID=1149755 RepID=A0A2J6S6P3_HYAVF|nr:hypothetical protein L207DRAFT_577289 [Hyaloscypha variabilis F]